MMEYVPVGITAFWEVLILLKVLTNDDGPGGQMISALNGTISALRAFVTKLGATADNIANVNTDGFKRNRAVLHEDDNGGVRVELTKDQSPGLRYDGIEDGEKVKKETSNVDLIDEIPDLMLTKRAYQANLKTIEAQDEMLGSLLDTIG
jgi:flagellar basal-body rod protein FlgC